MICLKKEYHFREVSAIVILFGIFFFVNAKAQSIPPDADSSRVKSFAIKMNAQLQSRGMYLTTGQVVTNNPGFNLFLAYSRKMWGFRIAKSLDLIDHNSDNNFSLVVVNSQFIIGSRIFVTPNIGFALEQKHTIADRGSDVVFILNTEILLTPAVKLGYDAVFQDLVIIKEYNWTNRVKLIFEHDNFDINLFLWHRNNIFNNVGYLSTGMNVGYNKVKITSNLILNVGATLLLMIQSQNIQSIPKRNGLMISIGYRLNS